MKRQIAMCVVVMVFLLCGNVVFAGPYTESGIAGDDPSIIGWATGYLDYLPAESVGGSWDDPTKALGAAAGTVADVVSLGECTDMECEPGEITLTFDVVIGNGDGPDFAVFENAFQSTGLDLYFCELAYVDVSTDGESFVRFPGVSLREDPVGPFIPVDPTDIFNYPGKHLNGYGISEGTPFDLVDLENDPLVLSGDVNLNEINFIRLVDIPGFGGYQDSLGNAIYDPVPTIDSAGFDLEAIAVINEGQVQAELELSYFHANDGMSQIQLNWQATVEKSIDGYYLWKAVDPAGEYTRVNTAMISAAGSDEDYEWIDTEVKLDMYYFYKLEAIDAFGVSTMFGPEYAMATEAGPGCSVASGSACDPLLLLLFAISVIVVCRSRKHA